MLFKYFGWGFIQPFVYNFNGTVTSAHGTSVRVFWWSGISDCPSITWTYGCVVLGFPVKFFTGIGHFQVLFPVVYSLGHVTYVGSDPAGYNSHFHVFRSRECQVLCRGNITYEVGSGSSGLGCTNG